MFFSSKLSRTSKKNVKTFFRQQYRQKMFVIWRRVWECLKKRYSTNGLNMQITS